MLGVTFERFYHAATHGHALRALEHYTVPVDVAAHVDFGVLCAAVRAADGCSWERAPLPADAGHDRAVERLSQLF